MQSVPLTISTASLEYVRVRVSARKSGAVYNPTSDVVSLAFVQAGATPVSGDWKAAVWETDTSNPALPVYRAMCLVGTGGTVALAAGTYMVWVKVTDNPEAPVLQAGVLKVV